MGLCSMNDEDIEKSIINILKDSKYKLLNFERNHSYFGNMIAVIKLGFEKHIFLSDRGDIYYNGNLIFTSDYHVIGEDDSPEYFLKAINQLVQNK